MDPYLGHSQTVKREVSEHADLLARIRGTSLAPDPAAHLNTGTQNSIYAVGRTPSGLYLALRSPIIGMGGRDEALYRGETYCAVASGLAEAYARDPSIPRPPRFCIGVLADGIPSILTEDVSEGRAYHVREVEGHCERSRGSERERLFLDLDGSDMEMFVFTKLGRPIDVGNPSYFSAEHVLLP